MLKALARGEGFVGRCVLLLGGFDGIHVGHAELIAAAGKYGLPVGVTSISGGKTGGDLFTFAEREYLYERAGLSFAYETPFSESLKNTTAEAFLDELFSLFSVEALICGEDFRFGKDAAGTPELLKRVAPCAVEVLSLRSCGGEKVSSSRIKILLSEGSMSEANALLTVPYFIQGTVEHGRRVGRTLGFPTVNLTLPTEKRLVREGVYGGYAETPCGRFPAILNIGARPTFGVDEKKAEAYLDGFSGDLYGKTVRLFPTEFYRPVIGFSDADGLKAQLETDIGRLRAAR